MQVVYKAISGKVSVPCVYVKLFQIAAEMFLDIVTKASLIARDCYLPEVLCIVDYPANKYEEFVIKKYNEAIKEVRAKMEEEMKALAQGKLTYSTVEYLVGNETKLCEYYNKWKVDFPIDEFKRIKELFSKLIKDAGLARKTLNTLSNLAYDVPDLKYSEATVEFVELKRMYNEAVSVFEPQGVNFGEFEYFEHNSEMFMFKFRQLTSAFSTSTKDIGQLKDVFEETCAFFRKLLVFENATFDNLEEISDITKKFGDNFDNELDTM